MREPARGATDGVAATAERKFDPRSALQLAKNPTWAFTTLAMSAMAFALGGMAFWMPTYFARHKGLPLAEANTLFGGITVVAGLVGTFLGGWLGDALQKKTDKAYLLVSGVGMLLAVPMTYIGITSNDKTVYVAAWFLAEIFVFLNTGPANAVLVNVALPEVRATAIALSIFVYHLLGDAFSPKFIGQASDSWGLDKALLLTSVAMAVSGVLYLIGSRTLGRDTEAVRRAVAARAEGAPVTASA
jgi:sugar phosphate permease